MTCGQPRFRRQAVAGLQMLLIDDRDDARIGAVGEATLTHLLPLRLLGGVIGAAWSQEVAPAKHADQTDDRYDRLQDRLGAKRVG
jgi:hypothetical protein